MTTTHEKDIPYLKKPIRKPGYYLEQMDDELLLYNPLETRIMQFNSSASLIWSLCDGERSLDEIIALLMDLYPDVEGEVAADVRLTVTELDRLGCIEWR